MKCEKCNAEFTLKEQAKAKGCCPSCGEKLSASAYRDDAKAWRWYQYHSPMPLRVILAYVYLFGGGGLALMITLESANLGLWTVTDPAAWLSVIMAALIFLLPFFALVFTPPVRRSMYKCKICNSEFTLRKLAWKKGCCPSCGEKIPMSEYCSGVPDRSWWRMFRGAPIGQWVAAIFLALLGCLAVFNVLLAGLPVLMAESRGQIVQGIAIYVVFLMMLFQMLKAVVRGSIPYVCIIALAALGWWLAMDSLRESLFVFVPLAIYLLPFFLPASRRWARKIREEDLAYLIAARSGAYPFRRMVVKYTLKKIAIGALLLVCLGLWACGPESIERMCDWLKHRSEEVMSIH